ncbi:flagellar basal-body rod protein FlgF [Silvibacterium dinghuense]|uniref:Flagellar basal-body rod protein FlgF n=1 Tax=Silvibacterium dinghuense TaxID=1560006 RepID=A0A4Q1SEF9_9BACT|nr:flagellar basal-body rod protein FlgF [Silvibacterium dinghuense]RXS95654.1 flagellar basal-body rod protein FlgF [Silvibacterium dinghuense]GGH14717.1 flagellar basal-body rod protein FlgF [Silvibacterium dinghuense]
MSSGFYAAYSGLLARTEALDAAASNLSNASTRGFRAEREFFRGAVMGPDALGSQLNRTVNDFGILAGNVLNLSQGALAPTGNPFDLALQGQGFFAVQTENGIRYTRSGQFQRSSAGVLMTADGHPVLNVKNQPITLPVGEFVVSSDGEVSVDGAVVTTLGLWNFAAPEDLNPEGTSLYAPAGKAKPVAAKPEVRQGALEGSNQDVIEGTLQLILVQRQAEMMQKALTVFDGNLDKTASEVLPKV